MKKILLGLSLVLLAGTASAQWHHHGHYRYYGHHGYYGGGWVAPLIIGGVVGAAIARDNTPVVVQQQPSVIVQQPPVVYQQPVQNCSPWTETQGPDGAITRTRTCNQ